MTAKQRLNEIKAEILALEAEGPARYNASGDYDPVSAEARAVALGELEGEKRGLECRS